MDLNLVTPVTAQPYLLKQNTVLSLSDQKRSLKKKKYSILTNYPAK